MLEGGCSRCGRYTSLVFKIDDIKNAHRMICTECNSKHYSKEAIRNKKIQKLTKKWWEFWK